MGRSESRLSLSSELYRFDREKCGSGEVIVGIDEVGRGPFAGPVVAAAVVLDLSDPLPGINDSKKISASKRETVYELLVEHAVAWAIGSASADEVDRINVLQATFVAMHRALEALKNPWNTILVDGNKKIPQFDASVQECVVGGDAKSASIAAASILAKVTRDRLMTDYDQKYPVYAFAKNKGYGTKEHRLALRRHGISPIHRKTFCEKFVLQTALDI